MLISKQKQTLKHYRSLGNFNNGEVRELKNNRLTQNEPFKSAKHKQKPESRLATQINQKIVATKDQLKKFAKMLKNEPSKKKEQKKLKNISSVKSPGLHQSSKKQEKTRQGSPIASKFIPKQEKKGLKKGKQQKSQICFSKGQHGKSIGQKVRQSKSKQRMTKIQKSTEKLKTQPRFEKIYGQISFDSTPSCLIMEDLEMIEQVGQGTFGKVYLGKNKKTGQLFAIKKVLQDSRYKNRQIQIIALLDNDFICEVLGSYVGGEGNQQFLHIIMKYYPQNLFQRIKSYPVGKVPRLQTKIIIYQIIKGLSYLHSLNICHRDIKPENILLKDQEAVICDFGSAKILNQEANISYICARCYRAPELIFGSTSYTTQIDMWSVGCVILQILNGDPLFIGDTSVKHLLQIFQVLGTPSSKEVHQMNPDYEIKSFKFPSIQQKKWKQIFPAVDPSLLQLVEALLVYSPKNRLTAPQALALEYFDELRDQLTYTHISGMYHLGDFFYFSQQQLKSCKQLRPRLVPYWYSNS